MSSRLSWTEDFARCLVIMSHSKLPLQGSLQTPLQTSVILLVVDVQEGLGGMVVVHRSVVKD